MEKNLSGRSDVVEVIRSLEPYKGGNAALRAIHDLDIDDKHVALIPAIGVIAVPAFGLLMGRAINQIPGWKTAVEYDGQIIQVMPDADNVRVGQRLPAALKLVFPSGTAFAGHEIVPTLHDLTKLTNDTIDKLAMLRPGGWPEGFAPGASMKAMRRALIIGHSDKPIRRP
ncbi:MAG: hypothetical protein KGK10_04985 [Rhodospirillales bacterium]|nr:hypothetical protein [Rhodospirillales bacterium]